MSRNYFPNVRRVGGQIPLSGTAPGGQAFRMASIRMTSRHAARCLQAFLQFFTQMDVFAVILKKALRFKRNSDIIKISTVE